MSIIAKFPWHRGEYYTVLQRDHLFEALKSISPVFPWSILTSSCNRDTPHFDA
jgi:hypothetical protein